MTTYYQRLANAIKNNEEETENTDYLKQTTKSEVDSYKDKKVGVDCSDINVHSEQAVSEILYRAGLNWNVEVQDGLGDNWEYVGSPPRATYRWINELDENTGNPTGKVKPLLLGMATQRRKPFQNEDIVRAILNFCSSNGISIDRVGTFDRGVRLFAICDFDSSFKVNGEDEVENKIIITHSHDVGSLRFSILSERLVCKNQMVLPVTIKRVSMRHDQVFSPSTAISKLEELQQGVSVFERQAENLASSSIRTTDLDNESYTQAQMFVIEHLGNPDKSLKEQPIYVQEILGDTQDMLASAIALKTVLKAGSTIKTKEEDIDHQSASLKELPSAYSEILDLYHNGPGSEMQSAFNTPWGILNAITHYYNHNSRMKGGVEGHYNSLWNGAKAGTCQYALRQTQAVSSIL